MCLRSSSRHQAERISSTAVIQRDPVVDQRRIVMSSTASDPTNRFSSWYHRRVGWICQCPSVGWLRTNVRICLPDIQSTMEPPLQPVTSIFPSLDRAKRVGLYSG